MTPDYAALIRNASCVAHPGSEAGRMIADLVRALETLLYEGVPRPASTEEAIREDVNRGAAIALHTWADWCDDAGQAATAAGLRWLARNARRPGGTARGFRWMPDDGVYDGSATWALPFEVLEVLQHKHAPGKKGVLFPTTADALHAAAEAIGPLLTTHASLFAPRATAGTPDATGGQLLPVVPPQLRESLMAQVNRDRAARRKARAEKEKAQQEAQEAQQEAAPTLFEYAAELASLGVPCGNAPIRIAAGLERPAEGDAPIPAPAKRQRGRKAAPEAGPDAASTAPSEGQAPGESVQS